MSTVEIAIRFSGVTALAFIAVLWLRDVHGKQLGILVALFCFSIASYLLCPPMVREWQLGIIEVPFFIGCYSAAVFFFLMSRAIFDDQFQLRPWNAVLLIIMIALGFWHRYAESMNSDTNVAFNSETVSLALHQILSLGITVSALVLARKGKASDLVESRRKFRDVFVGVCGGYILIVLVVEIVLRDQTAPQTLELINIAAIFLLSFVFAIMMTQLKSGLEPVFAFKKSLAISSPTDPEIEKQKRNLEQLIEARFIYRQEGLSIGQLAAELDTQEYLLRRLINGELGYRNFNEFLNFHRITEIQTKLSNPELVKMPILTLAMDCGYSSLGPFNRAFKEQTGVTPKEYRAQKLAL